MAIKRTVYSFEEIESNFASNSKLILFKYYRTLKKPITYNDLIKTKLLKSAPISIVRVDSNLAQKLINI